MSQQLGTDNSYIELLGLILGFKSTVIAGVISTLLASFFTWLFGFWPTVWGWLTEATEWAWKALIYAAPVPISVLAALLICLIYLSYRLSSVLAKEEEQTASSYTAPLVHGQSQMSEKELDVIKILAAADGRWLGIEHISSRIQASRLVTEQAVERLLVKKMLLESHNYIHGSSFRLSPEGRDYAIEQAIVK